MNSAVKNLFDFKNKTNTELLIRMGIITAITFVLYHGVKFLMAEAESFGPIAQRDRLGPCDDPNSPNVGCKWYNYIRTQ